MLGLLPSIDYVDASYTISHVTTTYTATSVLQLPLKLLRRAANCCTATQLLRSKQLKDITQQLADNSVWLHLITEAPYAAALCCLSRAFALLLLCST